MSVVVYHDGAMFADTRAYSGSAHPVGNKMKIHRLNDGSLLGMSSSTPGLPEEFKEWVERGSKLENYAPTDVDLEALLVTQDGSVYLYHNSYYRSGPLIGTTFTIGSGKKYALGAIHAGLNGVQAVEIAIACDPFCGGPVSTIPLREASPEASVKESEPTPARHHPDLIADVRQELGT